MFVLFECQVNQMTDDSIPHKKDTFYVESDCYLVYSYFVEVMRKFCRGNNKSVILVFYFIIYVYSLIHAGNVVVP